MPTWFFLILGLLIGFIAHLYDQENNITKKPDYTKWVAYHEAAHAVIAIFNGMRCLEVMLNIDEKRNIIHRRLRCHGYAVIHPGSFRNDLELIEKSTMLNLNIDALPRDPRVINFAKRYLEMLYAGDLVLHKFFDVPLKLLAIIDKRVSAPGEDLNAIQNIRDYLEKVGEPVTEQEAMYAVGFIIDSHKEVRAAIHFIADKMLKYPGIIIPEAEIIADLRDCKFFDVYKKSLGDSKPIK